VGNGAEGPVFLKLDISLARVVSFTAPAVLLLLKETLAAIELEAGGGS